MPRKSRKKLVGQFEEADRAERERQLRRLRRELRAAYRQRRQSRVDGFVEVVPTGDDEAADS